MVGASALVACADVAHTPEGRLTSMHRHHPNRLITGFGHCASRERCERVVEVDVAHQAPRPARDHLVQVDVVGEGAQGREGARTPREPGPRARTTRQPPFIVDLRSTLL